MAQALSQFLPRDIARDYPGELSIGIHQIKQAAVVDDVVAAVVKEYRVYVAAHQESGGNYTVDHSSFYYLINPEGKFVRVIAADVSEEELADRLRHWMDKTV